MDMLRAIKNNKKSPIIILNWVRDCVTNLVIMAKDKGDKPFQETVHFTTQGFFIWT